MTLAEAADAIGRAYMLFPHFQATEATIRAWWSVFKEMPADLFDAALQEAILTEKSNFFPAPARIRELINVLTATPDDLETADDAWDRAWYNSPDLSMLGRRVAMAMGMANKGQWLEADTPFKKHEFVRRYKELRYL